MISSVESSRRSVTRGIPQRSVLDPALSSLFVGDLGKGIECTLSKFADVTKLGGVIDTPEGCAVMPCDVKQESWPGKNNEVQQGQV